MEKLFVIDGFSTACCPFMCFPIEDLELASLLTSW